MTDLQILDTYGYIMCPARSEFPTIGTLAGGDVRLLMDGTIRASVVLQYRPHAPGVNPWPSHVELSALRQFRSGVRRLVARTADPALDRQTTIEVTATIVEK